MTVDRPREAALKVLYEINVNGAYTNIALNKQLEAGELKDIDRAFVTELVYGTIKWRLTLDWVISGFSNIKLKKISPWILNILRLGAYQLLHMDKVPESAVCNESSKLAARYGHKASTGFVNALLRNMAKNKNNITYPNKDGNLIQYLSVKYSHPEWMVERFLRMFGTDFTESLLESNNSIPEFTVRTNTLTATRDSLMEQLARDNVDSMYGRFAPEAVIIKNPSSITRLNAFKTGLFQVQDESSMLVASVLDPKPDELVLDVCSAPGGKSTHLAQLMDNKGTVLARDIHEHKLELIRQSAKRLGIGIIKTELYDALNTDSSSIGKFDRVLLDAPCTGLGIIRRKPDIKWARLSSDETEITELQKKMLDTVAGYVKPGGVLVYSTCTILPEENNMMVERFLKENPEFFLDDIKPYIPEVLRSSVMSEGMLQLFPNRDGTDGFFIARMIRRGNS
jgi:ribosomal RNA small subunit methyltransferase RsmB